jgi:hypothetical protein
MSQAPQEEGAQPNGGADPAGKRSFWVTTSEANYRRVQLLAAIRGTRGTNAIAAEAFDLGLSQLTEGLEDQIAAFLTVGPSQSEDGETQ